MATGSRMFCCPDIMRGLPNGVALKVNARQTRVVRTSVARSVLRTCRALAALVVFSGCRAADDTAQRSRRADAPRAQIPAVPQAAPRAVASAVIVDTTGALVLDVWPLNVTPKLQMEETRRIVEHMHADLALIPGFERGALLASGDGSALALVIAWHSDSEADSASTRLTGWLRISSDSVARRSTFGTTTSRVRIRRIVGTPPMLSDAAMIQLTRFALKPGHSFDALAMLADSNLSQRVLQDTSAQGGATLAARDSGAVYVFLQARNATALDADFRPDGPLPFWAPFAVRTESLMSVVAVVGRR